MLVSTRGRYALRVVIDLAENANGGYIPMKDRIQAIPNHFLYHTIAAFRG